MHIIQAYENGWKYIAQTVWYVLRTCANTNGTPRLSKHLTTRRHVEPYRCSCLWF